MQGMSLRIANRTSDSFKHYNASPVNPDALSTGAYLIHSPHRPEENQALPAPCSISPICPLSDTTCHITGHSFELHSLGKYGILQMSLLAQLLNSTFLGPG